jgi:hypothetical protein
MKRKDKEGKEETKNMRRRRKHEHEDCCLLGCSTV